MPVRAEPVAWDGDLMAAAAGQTQALAENSVCHMTVNRHDYTVWLIGWYSDTQNWTRVTLTDPTRPNVYLPLGLQHSSRKRMKQSKKT